ncbi:MAG TPA: glycosyl hydrolase family 28-related protein, partial [Puia sp.]|nr:glycosyl hydrolase family 28-related protein [Puia sp.]
MKITSLIVILHLILFAAVAQSTEDRLPLSAFRSLRSSTPLGSLFYLAEPGKEGVFVRDPADRTTPDDSVMALRSADGTLFRRLADQGILNVSWFGATGNGAADDAFAIQKGIDYILNHPQAGRTLYFPPGSYKLSRPLLIARPDKDRYRQSSINLVGPAGSRDLGMGAASIIPLFNNTFA